jgi:heme/copper-type cytochrome/quinol oxidase subunit 3
MKQLEKLITPLIIFFIYYWACEGMTKLIWNKKNNEQFDAMVKFLGLILILGSILYIFGTYAMFGPAPSQMKIWYQIFLWFHLIYLGFGSLLNVILKRN